MLYTLGLHTVVCQLYLNKTGKKHIIQKHINTCVGRFHMWKKKKKAQISRISWKERFERKLLAPWGPLCSVMDSSPL